MVWYSNNNMDILYSEFNIMPYNDVYIINCNHCSGICLQFVNKQEGQFCEC